MAFSHIQRQGPAQRAQATAHLAQTMSLLGLNAHELSQKIETALAANPALELVEERVCPTCGRKLRPSSRCSACVSIEGSKGDEPLVYIAPPEDGYSRSARGEELPEDFNAAQPEDLASYVLRQIASELNEQEQLIAAHLLSTLDDEGLRTVDLLEVARYHHVPVTDVEDVAEMIMLADPVGVGAGSTSEAMLMQLRSLGDKVPNYELCARVITSEGMRAMGKARYAELGSLLGVSKAKAQQIAEFIAANLNPHPARAFWGSLRTPATDTPAVYHRPDLSIKLQEDGRLVVEVLWPLRGVLRVNPMFQEALQHAPEEKAEQWKIALEEAQLLVKCLGQRNQAIVLLMQVLAVVQREFILSGDAHLRPFTRASIAEELGVHESTVSRAVNGKSVELPSGKIVPLAQFFDRSLHVRTALKKIIKDEPKPLSDTTLAKLLAKEGYDVARRTVAKYRTMEGILPAHLRKPQPVG